MPDDDVDIPTPHGVVTLPRAQYDGVARCIELVRAAYGSVTWHRNACGCCVSVHADTDPVTGGYVVGTDGGTDWHDLPPHSD